MVNRFPGEDLHEGCFLDTPRVAFVRTIDRYRFIVPDEEDAEILRRYVKGRYPEDPLFVNQEGNRFTPSVFNASVQHPLLEKLGLPPMRFYELKASLQQHRAIQGPSAYAARLRMGHAASSRLGESVYRIEQAGQQAAFLAMLKSARDEQRHTKNVALHKGPIPGSKQGASKRAAGANPKNPYYSALGARSSGGERHIDTDSQAIAI